MVSAVQDDRTLRGIKGDRPSVGWLTLSRTGMPGRNFRD